jgi:hypothetical protein
MDSLAENIAASEQRASIVKIVMGVAKLVPKSKL